MFPLISGFGVRVPAGARVRPRSEAFLTWGFLLLDLVLVSEQLNVRQKDGLRAGPKSGQAPGLVDASLRSARPGRRTRGRIVLAHHGTRTTRPAHLDQASKAGQRHFERAEAFCDPVKQHTGLGSLPPTAHQTPPAAAASAARPNHQPVRKSKPSSGSYIEGSPRATLRPTPKKRSAVSSPTPFDCRPDSEPRAPRKSPGHASLRALKK
ncbi:hypothetical protein Srot_1148 [Segniliparus rotundus DSM 44985]|uniref:Uncharacterized protein n=1 Tax=Segniliparus rotundus (strain ATCC BAA-972 / CDC 1076 / CIP 108378 / DSM 44985 / JCM 13578) TaxID=640132 RepID=D6ZF96_SEGRD|nr:hypothetical protein Srot_1148 [Segniliparus rotundus DSM 44985]